MVMVRLSMINKQPSWLVIIFLSLFIINIHTSASSAEDPQLNSAKGSALKKVTSYEDRIIQDEIVTTDRGKISRWEIKDIKKDSFKWESYISSDGRKTWRMDQEVFANRSL